MKDFFVPKDLLLLSNSMGMNSDFSVRGFSGGISEAMATMTVTVTSSEALPWTPAEITTALWLDASDETTITLDGNGKITQVADKSGNARHATNVLGTGGLYANKTIDLTNYGTEQRLNFDGTFMVNTLYTVIGIWAQTNNDRVIMGTGTGTNTQYQIGWLNGYGWQFKHYNNDTWYTGLGTTLNTAERIHATYLETGGKRIRFNGTLVHSASQTAKLTANNGMFMRALKLREILFLVGTPSVTLMQQIEGYFAHKWDAINGNNSAVNALPIAHPYKSTAPYLE